MFNKLISYSRNLALLAFIAVILALSIRGIPGNPTSERINDKSWTFNGPFELSNERGRFALLYSLIEDHSYQFSLPLARFAAPDLGYTNGQYVSLFAPGVSFIVIPGYLLGKIFGFSQLGTFAEIGLFAIGNVFLIRKIAKHLGASSLVASVSGLIFLFATPAYAYSVTLYQHHISTFLLLLSIWIIIRYNSVKSLLLVWFLAATAAVVDYPNAFMILPIVVTALGRFFVSVKDKSQLRLNFLYPRVFSFIGLVLPFAFLLYFNQMSYKNPFQLSGGVANVTSIDASGHPTAQPLNDDTTITQKEDLEHKQNVVGFFRTRNILNGVNVLFFSVDRGMIVFTPVILIGFLGMYLAIKKNVPSTPLLIAVCGMNILLYAMWGDPQGGWAFGSRYLIPSYAILAIFIAYLLQQWREKMVFLTIFFVVLCYSVSVNTMGALTSNSNPPQHEAILLEKQFHLTQRYTYQRNIDLLNKNVSRSFVFQTFAKSSITAWQYYAGLLGLLLLPFLILFSLISNTDKSKNFKFKMKPIPAIRQSARAFARQGK
jgi:hypothetical protein